MMETTLLMLFIASAAERSQSLPESEILFCDSPLRTQFTSEKVYLVSIMLHSPATADPAQDICGTKRQNPNAVTLLTDLYLSFLVNIHSQLIFYRFLSVGYEQPKVSPAK
ncbi:hypothetical protein KUV89_05715 [Marinobacter hydrocarbonoclasticus]|nr:hypothetical protein [Marinobacter nauticus]